VTSDRELLEQHVPSSALHVTTADEGSDSTLPIGSEVTKRSDTVHKETEGPAGKAYSLQTPDTFDTWANSHAAPAAKNEEASTLGTTSAEGFSMPETLNSIDVDFHPPEQSEISDQEGATQENLTPEQVQEDSGHLGQEARVDELDIEVLELMGQQAQDAMPRITQVLWNGSRLKSLKLTDAGLGVTPSSFSLLSRPLAVNHVLVELNIAYNQMDCLAMALLATSLCHNSSIQRLCLANNRIAANGGRHLAQALKSNHGILHLDLSRNSLGPSGSSCVAMALNFNTCLTDLRIAGNAMGDEAACFFAEAIKRQGTLLTEAVSVGKIDLSDNGISTVGAEALLRALHVSPFASLLYFV